MLRERSSSRPALRTSRDAHRHRRRPHQAGGHHGARHGGPVVCSTSAPPLSSRPCAAPSGANDGAVRHSWHACTADATANNAVNHGEHSTTALRRSMLLRRVCSTTCTTAARYGWVPSPDPRPRRADLVRAPRRQPRRPPRPLRFTSGTALEAMGDVCKEARRERRVDDDVDGPPARGGLVHVASGVIVRRSHTSSSRRREQDTRIDALVGFSRGCIARASQSTATRTPRVPTVPTRVAPAASAWASGRARPSVRLVDGLRGGAPPG